MKGRFGRASFSEMQKAARKAGAARRIVNSRTQQLIPTTFLKNSMNKWMGFSIAVNLILLCMYIE